ncbi:MAG: hypothetical protein Q9170_003455 [Blastenia crenularia]
MMMKIFLWAPLWMLSVLARTSTDSHNPSPDLASSGVQQILHPNHPKDLPAENLQGYKIPPQVHQIVVSVENGLALRLADLDHAVHESLFNYMSLGKALDYAKIKATELNLTQVASDIELWVEHHPWKAAFYTASVLGFFAPEIISIPALEALGFGFAGVRAGTVAAKVQSVIGPVSARSVFAIWQSARMGGYGVEYVNGGVRALIALTDAAVAACNPLKDCKGLMSDGGHRSLGGSSATTCLTVVCAGLTGLNMLLG